jgi:iron complex outermembrane receptor protein
MQLQSSKTSTMASTTLVKTSLAIAIGALFAPAHAQTAANPVELDQVVVSAQKRTQNLQAVPISIEAMSAADLEKAGIKVTQESQPRVLAFEVLATLHATSDLIPA